MEPDTPPFQPICDVNPTGFAWLERQAFLKPWNENAFGQTPVRMGWYLGPPETPHAFLYMQIIAGEAEILRIATHPQQRRQGHAQALWRQFLNHRFNPNVEMVFLEVSAHNPGAERFYRSLGFKITGRRPDYYQPGEDALLMTWQRNAGENL